jgi:hypothetical protein
MIRVYVAGSSLEMDRARRAVERLYEAGCLVTSTWINVIASVGSANPTDVSHERRRSWSVVDLAEVTLADVLWFLVPPTTVQTRGAWVELGHAYASGKQIVCSGDSTAQSIFTALGAEFATDDEAFSFVTARRTLRTKSVTIPGLAASVVVSDVDTRFDDGGEA